MSVEEIASLIAILGAASGLARWAYLQSDDARNAIGAGLMLMGGTVMLALVARSEALTSAWIALDPFIAGGRSVDAKKAFDAAAGDFSALGYVATGAVLLGGALSFLKLPPK